MPTHIQRSDFAPAPVQRASNASVDVVLLSADDEIFETTRNAIDESHRVWRAQTADEALERLVSGRCGVLVIDLGTATLEPADLVRQVTREFPDLVVVAAGRQADESSLASLISDGSVYRFMHKPLSPKRAGMFLSAAIRCHAERRQHPGLVDLLLPGVHELPERSGRRAWYAAAAGLLVVFAALAAYLLQREETPGDESGTRADELARPEGAGIPPQILLARADAAAAAGRLEAPAQDNALDLYRDVLLAQPQNAPAREGLGHVADQLLTRAHRESLAGRGDEARRLVRRVLGADPANPLALAMQARLETPELIQAAEARTEEPTESFMTLLRREFAAATRRTPRPATAPAASRAAPAEATRTASDATTGAAAALPPPVSADNAAGAATAAAAATAPVAEEAPASTAGSSPSLVRLSELSRVSTSQPDYPDTARRTGTEGWVRLEFTVNERGRVSDIVVVDAEPAGVFDNAASSALSRWRFRPPASGEPARTSVLLRFELAE